MLGNAGFVARWPAVFLRGDLDQGLGRGASFREWWVAPVAVHTMGASRFGNFSILHFSLLAIILFLHFSILRVCCGISSMGGMGGMGPACLVDLRISLVHALPV